MKDLDCEGANISLIFDDQNGLSISLRNRRCPGLRFVVSVTRDITWKIELDRVPYSDLAVDLNVSAGLFDEAMDLR